jgi:hypothetical protein
MAWVGIIVDVLLKVLKSLFGMDKPATEEVINEKPKTPVDNRGDDELLSELGMSNDRPENTNGYGDCVSGEAVSGDGKQDVEGSGSGRKE